MNLRLTDSQALSAMFIIIAIASIIFRFKYFTKSIVGDGNTGYYGDVVRKNVTGKILERYCALYGVIILHCFAVPIVLLHFNKLYKEYVASSGQNMSKEEKTLVIARTLCHANSSDNVELSRRFPLISKSKRSSKMSTYVSVQCHTKITGLTKTLDYLKTEI